MATPMPNGTTVYDDCHHPPATNAQVSRASARRMECTERQPADLKPSRVRRGSASNGQPDWLPTQRQPILTKPHGLANSLRDPPFLVLPDKPLAMPISAPLVVALPRTSVPSVFQPLFGSNAHSADDLISGAASGVPRARYAKAYILPALRRHWLRATLSLITKVPCVRPRAFRASLCFYHHARNPTIGARAGPGACRNDPGTDIFGTTPSL